ncbi:thiolase C-terminal domain-containing protein [Streptodolium elevatio]
MTEPPGFAPRAAIAGIGHTEFSKDSGRSELRLACEASRAAIADAGLTPADIDGTVTFTLDANSENEVMNSLGIREVGWMSRTPNGGAGAAATVQHAAAAIHAGLCRNVLIYRAFNERSGKRFGVQTGPVRSGGENWHVPYGLRTPAQMYGLWYHRWMLERGMSNADLGHYTVTARAYAATNPHAWFHGRPITHDDHQNSRWIVEPVLRLLDCCQESDGGVALVVTGADRARDLRDGPVARIAAAAQADVFGGVTTTNYYHDDLAAFPEAESVARRLWAAAGLGPGDIQAAMLYENFSPVVFMLLESLGFCGRGESADFVRDGHLGPGGKLPVNTHGGLLGEGYIHGMNSIVEAVRQIRGGAANQVAGVEHVLVSAGASGLILAADS